MADTVSMDVVKADAFNRLDSMVSNSKNPKTFIKTRIYPEYQNDQMRRWMSEGSSEGLPWKALNPAYAIYKRRRYGGGTRYKWIGGRGPGRPWKESGNWPNYPGNGQKMLIATGNLAGTVIGEGKGFQSKFYLGPLFTDSSMQIQIKVPYGSAVNQVRNFIHFSPITISKYKKMYAQFILSRSK